MLFLNTRNDLLFTHPAPCGRIVFFQCTVPRARGFFPALQIPMPRTTSLPSTRISAKDRRCALSSRLRNTRAQTRPHEKHCSRNLNSLPERGQKTPAPVNSSRHATKDSMKRTSAMRATGDGRILESKREKETFRLAGNNNDPLYHEEERKCSLKQRVFHSTRMRSLVKKPPGLMPLSRNISDTSLSINPFSPGHTKLIFYRKVKRLLLNPSVHDTTDFPRALHPGNGLGRNDRATSSSSLRLRGSA